MTVEPTSARFIDLSEWASVGGESFKQGNIRLFYTGKDLALGAQIYLVNEQAGLSFEEKLAELGKFDSRRLEGIWTMPSREATVKIALTNTTDDTITANARLTRRPNITGSSQAFTLAPHETRLLDLKQDFTDGQQAANSQAVALSLDHNGTNWALLARAFIAEPARGYSNLAQFANPLTGKTKEYHGAGLQLRTDTGERLRPVVVVKNTAGTNATVTGKVPYARADGSIGSVTLPTTQLGPNGIKLLDLSKLEQRNNTEEIKVAGLEIRYNTPEGSVVIATHTESANKRKVFRVPMWDPLRQKTATGGYPWRIEGTSTTKAYIKNITDRPQKYVSFFNWENGGMYMIGLKELAARQTVEIDVKDLRDRQVEDEIGRTIPPGLSKGQLHWSLRPEEGEIADTDPLSILALLGRSDQIDYAKEISSNYACENCCVNNPTGSRIVPNSAEIEVGETVTLRAQVSEETCTQIPIEHWEDVGANWSTNSPGVASVSGGTVTGQSAGTTTIRASFTRARRAAEPCPPGGPYLTGCTENRMGAEGEDEEGGAADLEPQCGTCGFAGTYYANPAATVTVKCAKPTNFRQDGPGRDSGLGTLSFTYKWDSSTENLADLSACTVGEIVTYPGTANPYIPPGPPFNVGYPNPTVIDLPGTDGALIDNHRAPDFVTPYSSESYIGTQYYRYKCPCANNGNYVNLAGPISIIRSISPSTGTNWKYTITKSGSSVTIDPLPPNGSP